MNLRAAVCGVMLAVWALGCGAASVRPASRGEAPNRVEASGGNLTVADLGAYFDGNFAQLIGPGRRIEGCDVEPAPEALDEEGFVAVATNDQLRANLRAWGWEGVVEASITHSTFEEFGSYRVVRGEERRRLNLDCMPEGAPEIARYYLAEVVLGWSYEVAFRRGSSASSASLSYRDLGIVDGRLEAFVGEGSVARSVVGRGLRREGPEVDPHYVDEGDPVVVIAVYTEIPRAERSRGGAGVTYEIGVRRLTFPPYAPGNVGWDPGGAPDPMLVITQDGHELLRLVGRSDALEEVWTDARVPTRRTLDARSPWVVRFYDIDVFSNDSAGRVTIHPEDLPAACAPNWPLPTGGARCTFQNRQGVSVTLHLREG